MTTKYNVPGLTGKSFLIACYTETKNAPTNAHALMKILTESFGAIKYNYLVGNCPDVVIVFSDYPEHAEWIKVHYPVSGVYRYSELAAYLSCNDIVNLDSLVAETIKNDTKDTARESENNTEEDKSSDESKEYGEINVLGPDCCNKLIYVLTGVTGQRQLSFCRFRDTVNYGLVIQFSDRYGKMTSTDQLRVWLEQCEHRGYQPRFFWDDESALAALGEELHSDGVLIYTVIEKIERREEILNSWFKKGRTIFK